MAKKPSRPKSSAGLHDPVTEDQEPRSHAYFSLFERAAGMGYWRYDLGDRSHHWSAGLIRLMGLDGEPDADWLSRHVPRRELAKFVAAIDEAIATGTMFHHRAHGVTLGPALVGKTDQVFDIEGEVESGPDGRATALIGICQNVTQKVRDEAERARVQEQYRLMMGQASDIIIFANADGDILFASDALERLLGRTAAEIARERYLELVHPGDKVEARKVNVVPAPGQTLTGTHRMRHKDGHYLWLEVVARATYDEATGKVKNVVSVSRDITIRKTHEMDMLAAQARAEAANKAKSRFLANMSHELRTPLNAIIGFTELMRKKMFGALGSERYDEYATIIYDSGQHLLDLITDLLDMAKIEAGKLELNFERVDLANTIDDTVRMLQERIDAAGVELSVSAKGPLFLNADKRAVKQVLVNLLSNAVKFTPAGGFIAVTVKEKADRVYLSVRDTGIGIAANDIKRLGNPFEQVHDDAFVTQGGTGLGLALVKSLAESHGGALVIESVEGKGTTVSVDFPLARKARAAA